MNPQTSTEGGDSNENAKMVVRNASESVRPVPLATIPEIKRRLATFGENRALAKHQPCGCVICSCEDEEQCQGCGASNCGSHPVGQIPNPVYVTAADNFTAQLCRAMLAEIEWHETRSSYWPDAIASNDSAERLTEIQTQFT